MTLILRSIVLAVTAALGLFVGGWAAIAPESFYSSFPGFGRIWVAVDGPYNEHLIRDVGGLYLALAAGTIAAMFSRVGMPTRIVGIAWTVFGTPHLIYHLGHLEGFAPIDVIGNVVSLSGSVLLGILLIVLSVDRRPAASTIDTKEQS